jgi:hypothetical protein
MFKHFLDQCFELFVLEKYREIVRRRLLWIKVDHLLCENEQEMPYELAYGATRLVQAHTFHFN